MPDPVWRGTTDLTLGKAHWTRTPGKVVVKTDISGPYDMLIGDSSVQVGQAITGFGDIGLKVTEIEITELDGGAGRADITLEAGEDDATFETDPIGAPTYEIEWAEVDRPIELHPRCGRLKATRKKFLDGAENSAGKQRTFEDWARLTGTGDNCDYDDSFSRGPGSPTTWTLAEYKGLKEQGIDSYSAPYPVIRRTSIHFKKPGDCGAASGKLQTPPTEANFTDVSGYEWLGGPDRCTKNRRTFTRSTEWTGLSFWDHLLYEAA